MPKAIKKKIAKPAKTEENVKNLYQTSKNFFSERRKIVFPAMLGAGIVILVVASIAIYITSLKSRSAVLEYEGYKAYYGLYLKQPAQKEEQYKVALEKFKAAYDLKKSPLSLFYIASCYYDTGKYDDAMKNLKTLNERFPDDERYVPLSYYKMALIDLKKGDKEGALKLLDAINLYKTGSLKDLALLESARLLESMGKASESAKKYEELARNYPDSPFAEIAKTKIGSDKGAAPKS